MRKPLAATGRLGAAVLMVVASLPGHLQLVHRHAGGNAAHVHGNAQALAARESLDAHHHHHLHAHAPADTHRHAHADDAHEVRPHGAHDTARGPAVTAADGFHVHELNPFQQVARSVPPPPPEHAALVSAPRPAPRSRLDVVARAARSRDPPANLLG